MTREDLQKEYQEKRNVYEFLCREFTTQISELLHEARITTATPIEQRVKTWDSIAQKIERFPTVPEALDEIRDLAGIRIVALFMRDIEMITTIVESNFEVLRKEDTTSRLAEDQFGYGSIHYEVSPPKEWSKVPTLRKLEGLCAEIQVRTASQHIWAAASHALQYKREAHVPIPLRRSINRVAALLETVDHEFERVLVERGEYTQRIRREERDEPLNVESLQRTLDEMFPPENKSEEEQYGQLLDELNQFDVRSTTQLRSLIKKHLPATREKEAGVLAEARKELADGRAPSGTSKERTTRGVFFLHVGLTRTVLREEFEDYYARLSRKHRASK